MRSPNFDWNKIFEFTWRILVFLVAIAIILVVTSNLNRWEGGAGWQSTDDAYSAIRKPLRFAAGDLSKRDPAVRP